MGGARRTKPVRVAFGLGGNVGTASALEERFAAVASALADAGASRVHRSSTYRTAPVGPVLEQPTFLNAAIVCELPGRASPRAWLLRCKRIERALGRVPRVRFGPREIDIDILLWGARVIDTPELVVPHPRLHRRRFALVPLIELLGPAAHVPGHGRLGALLAACQDGATRIV